MSEFTQQCFYWRDNVMFGKTRQLVEQIIRKNAKIIHSNCSNQGLTIFMIHPVNYFLLVLPK